MSASILVTCGEQRATLACVRSLGNAGFRVHVTSSRGTSLAGASRYAAADHPVPDAFRDPQGFLEGVVNLAAQVDAELLLPMTDSAISALLPAWDVFGEVHVPFPGPRQYEKLSEKAQAISVARELGICVPRENRIECSDDAKIALESFSSFPVVVKPARSVAVTEQRIEKLSVSYATTRSELKDIVQGFPAQAFPLLLQERVRGNGLGVFLLVWEGEVLAAFAHRRVREKPPSGGGSVVRESVPLPSEVLEKCRWLLDAFDWHGVAMIEFKGESLEADPVLMEVNARFWGSLQLAIDSGVDFPRLLVRAALGEEVEPVLSYRTGVRLRWFWGDVDHLWARMRYSRDSLNLQPEAGGRFRALVDFIRDFGPATRNEVFRWADPGPALRETRQWFSRS